MFLREGERFVTFALSDRRTIEHLFEINGNENNPKIQHVSNFYHDSSDPIPRKIE